MFISPVLNTRNTRPAAAAPHAHSHDVERDTAFFNNAAADWDRNNTMSTPSMIRRLLSLAPLPQGASVLDLGTGTGVLLPYLSKAVGPTGHITAVDRSLGMLDRARSRSTMLDTPVDCVLEDFENTELQGRYDLIVLYCVLPHLQDCTRTLRRLRDNNLAVGGHILIAHPASRERINAIHEGCAVHSHPLPDGQELRRRLTRAGLNVTVVVDTDEAYALVCDGRTL